MSRVELVRCNPSAVAVGPCAGLSGVEFALLSGRSATRRTIDSEYLGCLSKLTSAGWSWPMREKRESRAT
jgi:hypothetical protein